jgi:hypothetical protein
MIRTGLILLSPIRLPEVMFEYPQKPPEPSRSMPDLQRLFSQMSPFLATHVFTRWAPHTSVGSREPRMSRDARFVSVQDPSDWSGLDTGT